MSRFDAYTLSARQALAHTREIAINLQHRYIRTEHVLWGLVGARDPLACGILAYLGVDAQSVRKALDYIMGGSLFPLSGLEPKISAPVIVVLDLAEQEARASGSLVDVGTEHLLLGLLLEGEGTAAAVLESFDITEARLRGCLSEIEVMKVRNPDLYQRLLESNGGRVA